MIHCVRRWNRFSLKPRLMQRCPARRVLPCRRALRRGRLGAARSGRVDLLEQLRAIEDLLAHRVVGYIPDMIFDKELDYLSEIGATTVPLAAGAGAMAEVSVAIASAGAASSALLPQAARASMAAIDTPARVAVLVIFMGLLS